MKARHIIAVILAAISICLTVFIPWLKRGRESALYGNYMCSIGAAARSWAIEHEGRWPPDFISMAEDVVSPKILICPGDHSRKPATSWTTFTAAQSSYEIVTTNLLDSDTNGVFMRCKIHGHLVYADALVFDGKRNRSKISIR